MKNIIKIIVLSTLFFAFTEAKAQDYRGMVMVRSHSMTEANDSLNVSIDVWVKQNSVEDFAAMRLVPKIATPDSVRVFPDIVIQGNNKRKTYDRWLKTMSQRNKREYVAPGTLIRVDDKTDTVFTYKYQLPYQMWMDDAVLSVGQELISYNDNRSLMVFALDSKVKLAARVPYEVQPMVSYTEPSAESKTRTRQGQAFLDFQVAKSQILPNYRRNPQELAKIQTAFTEIVNNPDVKINGLFIEGYASPEGRSETNERLSRERGIALKNYIVSNFNLPLRDDQIKVSTGAEDWEGLKRELETSNIARKDDVIAIIDNEQDVAKRKQKIQALAGGSIYRTMLQELYPQLRRVEYQIDFSVKDFTADEAIDLMSKNPELLSQRELYMTAQTYSKESQQFENIMLDIIPKQFSNDPIASINAAALMIRRGEMVAARRLLEKYPDNPAAWNNLGVIELYAGELDKAEQWLRKAADHGVEEAKVNLAEVDRKRDDNAKMERYRNTINNQ